MAGTFTILSVAERNGRWQVRYRLEALGQETTKRADFVSQPDTVAQNARGQELADIWESQLETGTNPLTRYMQFVEEPLVGHTRDVFRFLIRGIVQFPNATFLQALAALVAEFPMSPYGDFQAFAVAVQRSYGGLTWDQFKTFVLNNFGTYDPDAF